MSYNVAVIGAISMTGYEILNILSERDFPIKAVHALSPDKTAGQEVSFGDQVLPVTDVSAFDFVGIDLVFCVSEVKAAQDGALRAHLAGAHVIDATPQHRLNPDRPLLLSDVNGGKAGGACGPVYVSCPSSMAAQLATALAPLHAASRIRRVVVSTYHGVSERGREAMDELFSQTRSIFMNNTPEPKILEKRIAFNVIPQVGAFMDDRATQDEWQIGAEFKRLVDPAIKVIVHAVRVPIFVGNGAMVNVEFDSEMEALTARSIWLKSPGVTLIDLETDLGYVTPADVQGEDSVFVSRTRDDSTVENGLSFWCCADNLRKTGALNMVQIAERLLRKLH